MTEAKDKKKAALLAAARDVLGRYGFKKTTLEDIAEKAGMAKTSVYYYFESKKDILIAVANMELSRMMARMRAAVEKAPTPEEKLIGLVQARYSFLQEIKAAPGLSVENLQEMRSLVSAERDRFLGAEIELLKEIIMDGISKDIFTVDDPELFALVAISGLRGLDETFMLYGKSNRIAEGIKGQTNMIIYGIKKR